MKLIAIFSFLAFVSFASGSLNPKSNLHAASNETLTAESLLKVIEFGSLSTDDNVKLAALSLTRDNLNLFDDRQKVLVYNYLRYYKDSPMANVRMLSLFMHSTDRH